MIAEKKRPAGVIIIAILMIYGGIATLIGSIFTVLQFLHALEVLSGFTDTETINTQNNLIRLTIIFGYILAALSIPYFICAWALFKRKTWSWMMAFIITVIGIIIGIATIPFVGIGKDIVYYAKAIGGYAIDGIILWFLFRPNVKEYFGRVKIQTI